MAIAGATTLLTLVAFATLMGSVWLWLIAFARAAVTWNWLPKATARWLTSWLEAKGYPARLPLLPWSPRRGVPWALVDLLLLFGIWILATLAVQSIFQVLGWPLGSASIEKLSLHERAGQVAGNIAISLAILACGFTLIALRTGSTLRDFGVSHGTIGSDLRLGVLGFVMLAPPVYALQGLLVTIWKPSKHPLMEMFKGTPDTTFFVLLFFSAAVVAPLFEEFIFRVIIQGFLEKLISFNTPLQDLLVGGRTPNRDDRLAPHPQVQNAIEVVAHESAGDSANPYAPPREATSLIGPQAPPAEQPELPIAIGWLPIAISSAIFALLHYAHGPDWIPLFFLAAGMGYLYQRTHRLLPSLTVHALLNGLSLLALWVQVQAEK